MHDAAPTGLRLRVMQENMIIITNTSPAPPLVYQALSIVHSCPIPLSVRHTKGGWPVPRGGLSAVVYQGGGGLVHAPLSHGATETKAWSSRSLTATWTYRVPLLKQSHQHKATSANPGKYAA